MVAGKLAIDVVPQLTGGEYKHTWTLAGTENVTEVRDMIITDMQANSWVVKAFTGTSLEIDSWWPPLVGPLGVKRVAANHNGVGAKNQPFWTTKDGVQVGQASTGGVWSIQFAQLGTLDQFHDTATLTLTIDSWNVPVALTATMNHVAAAQAVQQAMVAAGFADAQVDGNGVLTFNADPDGTPAHNVQFTFSSGGDPTGDGEGLYLIIDIAARDISVSSSSTRKR
jgi:hypothetical protein